MSPSTVESVGLIPNPKIKAVKHDGAADTIKAKVLASVMVQRLLRCFEGCRWVREVSDMSVLEYLSTYTSTSILDCALQKSQL